MASVIHATAHGLVAGDRIRFGNVVPTDTGIDEATDYYVLAAGLTADDFEFSETAGGTPFVLAYDITSAVLTYGDTYTEVVDGVMDAPTVPVTPSAPTVTSALVSGIVRLRVTLNDTAETKARLWEVHITHKFDSNGDPDWTTPAIHPMPENSTELSIPALGSTVYAVRVRSQDVFGNFSAFSTATTATSTAGDDSLSASLASLAEDVQDGIITETKIADGSISTPKLQAGAVTADVLAATIVLSSLIKTADSGRRVEMDGTGITLFDTDGSVLVRIPTNGDPVYVKGTVDADSLVSETAATFRTAVSLDGSSVMTLQNGIAAPANVPAVAASVDYLGLTSTPADIGYGIGYDSGAGTFWIAADPTASGHYVAHEFNATTGALVRSISATGSFTTTTTTYGATSHVSDTAQGTAGSSDSQVSTPIVMPRDGRITKVSVYMAGRLGTCPTRVAIWNTSGTRLAMSSQFTAADGGATALGASFHYDKSLSSPLTVAGGTTIRVGWQRTSGSYGFQWDKDSGSSKTQYVSDGLDGNQSNVTTTTSEKPNVYITYEYDTDTRLETAKMIGVCTDGTYVYTLDANGVVWKYNRTTGAYVANSAVLAVTGTKANAGLFYDSTAAKVVITTANGTTGTDKTRFLLVDPSALTVSSTLTDTTLSVNGSTYVFRGGARVVDALNASTAEYWVPISGTVYAFVASTGANVANRDFGTTTTCLDGLTHDGTQFRGWKVATPTKVWKFTNWDWTTASAVYWFGYSWYDSAGTTHETACGPLTSLTLRRRERVQVQNAAIPTGGVDDPDKVRIYALPSASAPGAGTLWQQASDALTSRYLITYTGSGTHDGAGTAFPSGTPAEIKSSATGWSLKGDGSATFTTPPTTTKPVVRVYTSTGANTWTKPTGLAYIVVECVGGGGAGGGAASTGAGQVAIGAYGGGGGYARKVFTSADLASLTSATATVGTGGTAGTAGNNAGNNGVASTFAGTGISTVTGGGGNGGAGMGATGAAAQSSGGTGGTASGGDINISGGDGSNSFVVATAVGISIGQSGASVLGTAVKGLTASGTGTTGHSYGGGGAGGNNAASQASARTGGPGGQGIVIVTEYYI